MPKLSFDRRFVTALAVASSRAHDYASLSVFPDRS